MLGFHVWFVEDCIYLRASIRSCNTVTAKVEISLVSFIFVVREERIKNEWRGDFRSRDRSSG